MHGVLLIDKPAGMSSHDVVAAVRHSLGGARTGHAGTLDPFATGLLLVLVGRATKAQSTLMGLPKRYETVAQLGASSSTGDTEGEITRKLPSERSFAEEYGVAYTTVRHAMALLRERGLIVTVHGRGTYVKP